MNGDKLKFLTVFKNIRYGELLIDALTCLLLSTGAAMALLSDTVLAHSLIDCIIPTAVAIILITFLSRRWWFIPAVIAIIAAGLALSHWIAGDITDVVGYGRLFVQWLFSGASYQENITDAGFLTAVRLLIIFMISSIIFTIIRKFFSFALILALVAGAVFYSFFKGDSYSQTALCICAAGLIVILPRVNARALTRVKKDMSSDGSQTVSRVHLQALAIPAAVFAVSLALIVTPKDTAGWKSHALTVFVEDINAVMGARSSGWPQYSSNFSMYGIGFQPRHDRLGGPVKLNERRYLSVRTTAPVLLKGKVLDYYNGSAWLIAYPDGDMRFNSLFWRDERREAFDTDKPVGTAEADRLYQRLTVEQSIYIKCELAGLNAVFTAGQLRDITFNKQKPVLEAYFNNRSEIYMRSSMSSAVNYTLTTRVWNTGLRDFDSLFLKLEKEAGKDERFVYIQTRYTQLPDSLPNEVRRTAMGITDGIESPYLRAQAISKWLYGFGTYTLSPEMPPEGKDFTAWFLESGEGYCVYYATAMTVLARCAGLPARYVQGFALNRSQEESNLYYATGSTAHAWSEVYFEGIGWMPVDPLSWNPVQNLNATALRDTTASSASLAVIEETQPTPSAVTEIREPESDQPDTADSRNWIWLLVIPAIFGLMRWVMYSLPRYFARRWSFERVRRRYGNTSDQMDALYYDILSLLAPHKLTVREKETLISFPERVDHSIRFDGVTLSGIGESMMRSRFGELPPSDGDVEYACRYHEQLDTYTLERMGKPAYLLMRISRLARKK